MNTIPDFENELKAIDSRLSIVINQNLPDLANVKLNGATVCVIPSGEIKDEPDPSYRATLPNGMSHPHRSRAEALAMTQSTLEKLQDKDYHDAFFGIGEYK
jgi:hypothetical protein